MSTGRAPLATILPTSVINLPCLPIFYRFQKVGCNLIGSIDRIRGEVGDCWQYADDGRVLPLVSVHFTSFYRQYKRLLLLMQYHGEWYFITSKGRIVSNFH